MLLAGGSADPDPVFCNWRAFLDSRLRGNDDSNGMSVVITNRLEIQQQHA
jgi:hypothetical protein